MLSYQHVYHAGGPADVHKHALLWALLDRLRGKDKPFVAIDLYAGEGLYDLSRPEAQKIAERAQGIARLWNAPAPAPLADYLAAVRTFNPGGTLGMYPGSPAVIRAALRADDRLIVNELHPAAAPALRAWAHGDARIAVHQRDAHEAIAGLLPPAIRRGLLLIDPSYEDKDDYVRTAEDVITAHTRWPEGIIVVWFPRLADKREDVLVDALEKIAAPCLLSALELDAPGLADAPARGLRGSGMAIVNPPWQFETTARAIGDALALALGQGPKARHEFTQLAVPKR